jgi:putative transposase
VTYYERHLPHWHPEGAALFVTWRLYGSLPSGFKREGKTAGEEFAAVDRELAAVRCGPRWLQDERIAKCVQEAFRYGEQELTMYQMRAWVVMPNHVHILIFPDIPLGEITKSIKRFTALQANAILGRTGIAFWQDECYDHWVRDRDELEKIVRYIERNPVKAGLAARAEDWRWSSAYGG